MEGLPADHAAGGGHPTPVRAGGRRRGGGPLSTGQSLILLRHGRTAWNAGGRFQGQLDPPLDDTGEAQAQAAAAALAGLRPVVLLSSDLQRARVTAATLGARLDTEAGIDPGLREIGLGDWQGLTGQEAREQFPDEYDAWVAGRDIRRGGGETYAEVGERAVAVVQPVLDSLPAGGTLVAVTHGGTARAVLGVMLGLEPGSWWRLGPLGNCRWSLVVREGRGWRLAEHNAGNLPDAVGGDDAAQAAC